VIDYTSILTEIKKEIEPFQGEGAIATYIPELAKVNPEQFGVHIRCLRGGDFATGASETLFSIQSISKVLSLALAMKLKGEKIWERVGVEPSGDPFNSLVQLEYENGIPRNPFINAGALVIADLLISELDHPKDDFLEFIHRLSGDTSIQYDEKVATSEKAWGYRNAALANFLKAYGNIENGVEEVLDFYFHKCSIAMSCRQLSCAFTFLANQGQVYKDGEQVLTLSQTKRMNALMQTCGFYDEAGEFSFRVGIPGKSGVGGGIAAIHPEEYSIAVWSPRLNPKGNSVLGLKTLELLTTKTGLSIF
jgi:glutaminase